jgi:hypothetical protein
MDDLADRAVGVGHGEILLSYSVTRSLGAIHAQRVSFPRFGTAARYRTRGRAHA